MSPDGPIANPGRWEASCLRCVSIEPDQVEDHRDPARPRDARGRVARHTWAGGQEREGVVSGPRHLSLRSPLGPLYPVPPNSFSFKDSGNPCPPPPFLVVMEKQRCVYEGHVQGFRDSPSPKNEKAIAGQQTRGDTSGGG